MTQGRALSHLQQLQVVRDGERIDLPPATRRFEAGTTYGIVIEMVGEQRPIFNGLDLRVRPLANDNALRQAVQAAAAAAAAAVVVVGTNDDWETEGEDRTSLALPCDQDALVAAVLDATGLADDLKQRGVTVIEKDIEASEATAAELKRKLERANMSGASIPIIDVMGQLLVGYSPRALDRAIATAENAKPL